jgi:hypothetical protein
MDQQSQQSQSSYRKGTGKKGRRQNQNQQNGGAGTADHMMNTVGNTNSQVAQMGRGNEIATTVSGQNPDLGSSFTAGNGLYSASSLLGSASPFKGGKKRSRSLKKGKRKGRKGGNLLSTLAVPAVYLYANNTFGKRRSSGRKTRRFRRSRRSGRR